MLRQSYEIWTLCWFNLFLFFSAIIFIFKFMRDYSQYHMDVVIWQLLCCIGCKMFLWCKCEKLIVYILFLPITVLVFPLYCMSDWVEYLCMVILRITRDFNIRSMSSININYFANFVVDISLLVPSTDPCFVTLNLTNWN